MDNVEQIDGPEAAQTVAKKRRPWIPIVGVAVVAAGGLAYFEKDTLLAHSGLGASRPHFTPPVASDPSAAAAAIAAAPPAPAASNPNEPLAALPDMGGPTAGANGPAGMTDANPAASVAGAPTTGPSSMAAAAPVDTGASSMPAATPSEGASTMPDATAPLPTAEPKAMAGDGAATGAPVQKLQEKIASLEARVAALESGHASTPSTMATPAPAASKSGKAESDMAKTKPTMAATAGISDLSGAKPVTGPQKLVPYLYKKLDAQTLESSFSFSSGSASSFSVEKISPQIVALHVGKASLADRMPDTVQPLKSVAVKVEGGDRRLIYTFSVPVEPELTSDESTAKVIFKFDDKALAAASSKAVTPTPKPAPVVAKKPEPEAPKVAIDPRYSAPPRVPSPPAPESTLPKPVLAAASFKVRAITSSTAIIEVAANGKLYTVQSGSVIQGCGLVNQLDAMAATVDTECGKITR